MSMRNKQLLRKLKKELKNVFKEELNESIYDFDTVGNIIVWANHYPHLKTIKNQILIIQSRLEFLSIISFESICIFEPLIRINNHEFQDIVFLKHLLIVIYSFLEKRNMLFSRQFIQALEILKEKKKIRSILRKIRIDGDQFIRNYKVIRNSIIAHRVIDSKVYLGLESILADKAIWRDIINILLEITQLRVLLLDSCINLCCKEK